MKLMDRQTAQAIWQLNTGDILEANHKVLSSVQAATKDYVLFGNVRLVHSIEARRITEVVSITVSWHLANDSKVALCRIL